MMGRATTYVSVSGDKSLTLTRTLMEHVATATSMNVSNSQCVVAHPRIRTRTTRATRMRTFESSAECETSTFASRQRRLEEPVREPQDANRE
mgnify:FL=1